MAKNELDKIFGNGEDDEQAFELQTQLTSVKTQLAHLGDYRDQETDLKKSRETLHGILDTGETAMTALCEMASHMPHPMVFEQMTKMMKVLGDISTNLVEIHKHTSKEKPKPIEQEETVISSPKDLL